MQPVEKKIEILANRVDDVYQILDRLHQHLLPEVRLNNTWCDNAQEDRPEIESRQQFPQIDIQEPSDWLVHQDVLIDSENGSSNYRRPATVLSPQSQIQRLTAQLTVAYTRIAALEEQLLSKQRVH
jgi:hypothetical protein